MGINLGQTSMKAVYLGQTAVKSVFFGNNQVWGGEEPAADWLCFTANEANSTVKLEKRNALGVGGEPPEISLEYSTNGNIWNDYNWSGFAGDVLTLAAVNDKVYIRAKVDNSNLANGNSHWHQFVMSGKIAASGNIQTLLKADGSRTDVPAYCYINMFKGCTALTTAPVLPVTTLAQGCCWSMFEGCTSLTVAPALPAMTLAGSCYYSMFNGCSALTSAPELPATTVFSNSYGNMFNGCTSLTQAPALPATTLADSCYGSMFFGCSSLTAAPALPATTLAGSCYMSMFRECTSLTTAPALPATALANYCYSYMFQDCSSLSSIEVPFTTWNPSNATTNWLKNVAASGTFTCSSTLPDTRGVSNIPEGWQVANTDAPLCFTAEEANSTVKLNTTFSRTISLETSTDKTTWTDYSWSSNVGDTLTLANVGDKVYMRAKNENSTITASSTFRLYFVMTGKIAASGNIQTLLKADGSRTDAPSYCYYRMFYNCTSLTKAPELPAMTLASNCYTGMFNGCTSLTTAPALPAITVAESCYNNMFENCSSLTTAPALPATTLASSCYYSMFHNCTSLTTAPALPATTLAQDCYGYMFQGCTSLTTAPSLPATTLASQCYSIMFYGCTQLSSVEVAFTEWTSGATGSWLYNVAASGTFTCPAELPDTRGTGNIPDGWTKVDAA